MLNFANIKPFVTKSLGRSGLLLQKYSPEILTAVGITGVVVAGVMASRATLNLAPILEEKRERLDMAKGRLEDFENGDKAAYNKDVAYIYAKTSLDIVKLYGPSITLGAGAIISIVGAQGIMRRRNIAIAAAYKTVEGAFSEYRKRVADELDADRELAIYHNHTEKVVVDEETGKEKTVVEPKLGHSPYAKFFDELSKEWQRNADYNLMFLKAQEQIFNDLLHVRGHVFLNEVYDALDIPRTQAGQMVGWVMDRGGDNYVDFGIYNFYDEKNREFVNGYERSIILDFNVDGIIHDLI